MSTTDNTALLERASKAQAPAGVAAHKIVWINVAVLAIYHALALLAVIPWFFSWTGVVLVFVGTLAFGTCGINLCYHRLLTHRGFTCPKWLEHFLAVLGCCAMQDTPAYWVAVHRRHHQHADERQDPHSPLVNFLWGHFAWLLVDNDETNRVAIISRNARDIWQDRFYARLERRIWFFALNVAMMVVYYLAGAAADLLMGGSASSAAQFGASVVVWGVFVRTVFVWHITWSVNSVTHIWGYRNYNTQDNSRNNLLVGFLSNGEGWHNNHHADPRSARNGRKWWEFDMTWCILLGLKSLGLARDITMPNVRAEARSVNNTRSKP